jgi:hypothetical protein
MIQTNQAAAPNITAATPPISTALSGPAAPALLEAEAAADVPLAFSVPTVLDVAAETGVEVSVIVVIEVEMTTTEAVATLPMCIVSRLKHGSRGMNDLRRDLCSGKGEYRAEKGGRAHV